MFVSNDPLDPAIYHESFSKSLLGFVSRDSQLDFLGRSLTRTLFPQSSDTSCDMLSSFHGDVDRLLHAYNQHSSELNDIMRQLDERMVQNGSQGLLSKLDQDILRRSDAQHSRFLFITDSGRIKFSHRRPSIGDRIVLVPGSLVLHLLSQDYSDYIGCTSVYTLMGDVLLEVLDSNQAGWISVCL